MENVCGMFPLSTRDGSTVRFDNVGLKDTYYAHFLDSSIVALPDSQFKINLIYVILGILTAFTLAMFSTLSVPG